MRIGLAAMSAEVTALDLRLRRRSAIAYTVGVGVYALLIVLLYPAFEHDASLDSLSTSNPTVAALFGAAGSLTSPDGWMNANLYANFLPLFAILMTAGYGAAAVGGQDEDGTLGNVASLPITRRRVLLEKLAAVAALAWPVPVASFAAALIGRDFDIELRTSTLVQVTVTSGLMAFDFGVLALLVGTAVASRGAALGATAATAGAAYIVSSLAPVVQWVHTIRYVSPIYWGVGANQLRNGTTPGQVLLLVATGAVLSWLAARSFTRIDIH
jgi:ABC-2 type transport system permease protein